MIFEGGRRPWSEFFGELLSSGIINLIEVPVQIERYARDLLDALIPQYALKAG